MEHTETGRARGSGRGRTRARPTVIALALAAGVAVGLAAIGTGRDADRASVSPRLPSAPAGAVAVSVSVDAHHRGRRVPRRFLGLSFEASSLAQIATFGGRGNLVSLLRSLGPGMLRFGGVSADTRTAWTDAATPRPAWASGVLVAGDLRRLAALAARSDWRVLLTVGLAHYEPGAAAREVRAGARALGTSLAGVEIGNEPDAYARHALRAPPWNPVRYDAQVRAYRGAIRRLRLRRSVRLAAPGVSGSHSFLKWAPVVARAERPALLTGHHYPLGCHQEPAPSIAGLLSPRTRHLAGTSLTRFMSVSRRSRIAMRIDETNSVSCGGRPGISNTFASALWATDYISQAMT
ncbi:MAG: Ricin lectin, partial [Solirubrobacterales bacterium]|nr:Ricin lectin [Solirubrobacterales bacterium]